MAEFLTGVRTKDSYSDQISLGPASGVVGIRYDVLLYPVDIQFYLEADGLPGKFVLEGIDRPVYANTFGQQASGVAGIQFKSAYTGKPAVVNAVLSYAGDPSIDDPGTQIPGTIFAGGTNVGTASSSPGSPLSYIAGTTAITNLNSTNPVAIVTVPANSVYLMTACIFTGFATKQGAGSGSEVLASLLLKLSKGFDGNSAALTIASEMFDFPSSFTSNLSIDALSPQQLPLVIGGGTSGNVLQFALSANLSSAAYLVNGTVVYQLLDVLSTL